MAKHRLSAADLVAHFDEQLGALQRSAQLFDEGYQLEARRMAVTLRVILHGGRKSLLEQLGRKKLDFVDSAQPFNPDNIASTHSLISLRIGGGQVSYQAKLDADKPAVRTSFARWWKATVFADGKKRKMTRAHVVLTAANQDGGAHVDGTLRADYAELRHENLLGWLTGNNTPPSGDPAYVAIRQIAHEVLKTFIPGYSKTTEEVQAAKKTGGISGGKLRFYPHETNFLINEIAKSIEPGRMYVAEIKVDSITTGSVRMVVNTAVTDPVTSAGSYSMRIVAGSEQKSGVFGEYTDAVIDHVSIKQVQEIAAKLD